MTCLLLLFSIWANNDKWFSHLLHNASRPTIRGYAPSPCTVDLEALRHGISAPPKQQKRMSGWFFGCDSSKRTQAYIESPLEGWWRENLALMADNSFSYYLRSVKDCKST